MAECQFSLHHMEALLPFILVDAPILVHICRLFQTRAEDLPGWLGGEEGHGSPAGKGRRGE